MQSAHTSSTPDLDEESPLVSIGIPAFNAERYIAESVRSVLDQSWPNLEVVISDNGSTDRTVEIIHALAESDHRIRLISQEENKGAAWNYNEVCRQSRGEFFRWLAADDRLTSDAIKYCVEQFKNTPEAVLCFPQTYLIDENGETIRSYDDRLNLQTGSVWWRAARFIRRINLCNPVFGFYRTASVADTHLIQPFQGSDGVLLLEVVLRGPVVLVSSAGFERRVHMSASLEAASTSKEVKAWFDPANVSRFRVPVDVQLLWGYLGAVWRANLAPLSKFWTAIVVTVVFTYRRLRIYVGRLRRRLFRVPLDPRGRWGGLGVMSPSSGDDKSQSTDD